jgi:hypothetical protein
VNKESARKTIFTLSLIIMLISLFTGPIGIIKIIYKNKFKVTEHHKFIDKTIDLIPIDSKVCAQLLIVSHVANRKILSVFPNINNADYVLLDTTEGIWPSNRVLYNNCVSEILKDDKYSTLISSEGFLMLKKKYGK